MNERERDVLAALPTLPVRGSARRLVWLVFALHAVNDDALAYPASQSVAEETGLDRRDVRRYRDELVRAGELVLVDSSRGRRANVYRVTRIAQPAEYPAPSWERPAEHSASSTPTGGLTDGPTGGSTGGRTGAISRREVNGKEKNRARERAGPGAGSAAPRVAAAAGRNNNGRHAGADCPLCDGHGWVEVNDTREVRKCDCQVARPRDAA